MAKTIDVMDLTAVDLTQPLNGPPMKLFIRNNGNIVKEPCVLVGHVAIDEARRGYLDELGINTTWAVYRTGRWERCLISEAVADLLVELHAEGSFPFAFEAGPSQAEAAWSKARSEGAHERPVLPLLDYLLPADAEALDRLATETDEKQHRWIKLLPRVDK